MKYSFKKVLELLSTLAITPLVCCYYVGCIFLRKNQLFSGYSQLISIIPGITGSYLRRSFYRLTIEYCGKDSVLGFAVLFSNHDTYIGDNVYIGPQCNIGKCRIEKNCLLGSGVHILSGKTQHNASDLEVPIREQGGQYEKICIGEDTWIGNGAIVMAEIGKKSIIGAGSVVTNPIPDYSIVAGNPARVIKSRK